MIHSRKQKSLVNRLLGSAGLPSLDDGTMLIPQLAFLVRDHDHYRDLLMACDPGERATMYSALTPNLRFIARPLDVYVAEAGRAAEARQLPIQNEDGTLRAFNVPEFDTRAPEEKSPDIVLANASIEEMMAKGHLHLTCKKCTKQESFPGTDLPDAVRKARDAGWTYNEIEGTGIEICPECP
jgi:hypothetical protein